MKYHDIDHIYRDGQYDDCLLGTSGNPSWVGMAREADGLIIDLAVEPAKLPFR